MMSSLKYIPQAEQDVKDQDAQSGGTKEDGATPATKRHAFRGGVSPSSTEILSQAAQGVKSRDAQRISCNTQKRTTQLLRGVGLMRPASLLLSDSVNSITYDGDFVKRRIKARLSILFRAYRTIKKQRRRGQSNQPCRHRRRRDPIFTAY
jgi:hypothetical protein